MISMNELIVGTKWDLIPSDHQDNLNILLDRLNLVRVVFGRAMTITSGYRSMKHHLEIYAKKGMIDKSKIPLKSLHLFGQAADVYDPKKILQAWCLANVKELEEIELWMEDFSYTTTWCHFQILPPKSLKRFFIQ